MSEAIALSKYSHMFEEFASVRAVDENFGASSILLSGEDADGLKALARIIAARLTALDTETAFDEHADIIVYPKPAQDKKSKGKKADGEKSKRYAISVDDIKEIVDSLYFTPFELNKRVFIIENAENMSEMLQNKLLKSLEEPPLRVCFVLCAAGRMLPTVESRCCKIELPPFSVERVASELSKYHKDKAAVMLAARASRGNIGIAENILKDAGFADTYNTAKAILRLATGSKAFAKTAAVYEKLSRDRTDDVLGIMEYLLCDVAKSLAGAETVFDESDVKSIENGFTPLSAAKCAEHVRVARRHNAANGMQSAVMDTLILKIMEEKFKCAAGK